VIERCFRHQVLLSRRQFPLNSIPARREVNHDQDIKTILAADVKTCAYRKVYPALAK
jgi:hypothetical protein